MIPSDEFLDRVSPGMAVIQVGKNSFGHPTPEVLNKLSERKTHLYIVMIFMGLSELRLKWRS